MNKEAIAKIFLSCIVTGVFVGLTYIVLTHVGILPFICLMLLMIFTVAFCVVLGVSRDWVLIEKPNSRKRILGITFLTLLFGDILFYYAKWIFIDFGIEGVYTLFTVVALYLGIVWSSKVLGLYE